MKPLAAMFFLTTVFLQRDVGIILFTSFKNLSANLRKLGNKCKPIYITDTYFCSYLSYE